MTHYSPLKKLFRRQKALRGVEATVNRGNWEQVSPNVLMSKQVEYVPNLEGYSNTQWYMIPIRDLPQVPEIF